MPSTRVDFKHVRSNASFEAVARHYNIDLIGRGDQKSALCPFHDEDTPSLKINIEKNIFNCFGCGKHGNILEFVTYLEEGDPKVDADLRRGAFTLAEICDIDPLPTKYAGMASQSSRAKPLSKGHPSSPTEREKPPPQAAELSNGALDNKPLAFALKLNGSHPYLRERGLSEEAVDTFGLGFADRGLMKGRLAIPIHNENGELIAYAGRWAAKNVPTGIPKYLLPDGFHKQSVVFNLHRLADDRSCSSVVLVESYFSVIRLHELGYAAVSAVGHSLSEQQCTLLHNRGVKSMLVLFDGDEAGEQGICESVPLLTRHFYVHAPKVPDGFKPHRAGKAEIEKLLSYL